MISSEAYYPLLDRLYILHVAMPLGKKRKQKERQPMRNHREAAQCRGMEFVENHPVADYMFDIVGHHRHGVAEQIYPRVGMAQRSERSA